MTHFSPETAQVEPGPDSSMPAGPYVANGKSSQVDVGEIPTRPISDADLSRHISDCRYLRSLAQARLRGSHSTADAAEVARWDAALTEAIQARQAAYRDEESDFGGDWAVELARRLS